MNTETRPTPYPLRLEPETRARIETIAKANGRSLNAQIVMMLDDWLAGTNGNESPVTESRVLELIRSELDKRRP
ncbi:MAG: hypothetical protein BWK73_47085 [Thiothrix lacustris]|uniref:Arc-like DNA binding domain-containing protein n=1 Tax=Thiothrix lacustris TaxID=525917 RepID=A0A1Y1QAC7_9GAMM|nr:MAG: hypothetical protein BWK73_47085 [Thiothrix lacustris]